MQRKIIRGLMIALSLAMIPVAMLYMAFIYARSYIDAEVKGEIDE